MNILTFSWIFFFSYCFAETFIEEDRKLLSDIPEPTSENLRWAVPADGWRYIPHHLRKGQFFRVSALSSNQIPFRFKFYRNSKLEGKPQFEMGYSVYLMDEQRFCEVKETSYTRASDLPKGVLECTYATCKNFDPQKYKETMVVDDAEYLLNTAKYNVPCSFKVNYFARTIEWGKNENDSLYDNLSLSKNAIPGNNFYFKFESIAKDQSYLEVLEDGEKYYLDLRFCKEKPQNCQIVDIHFSDYEKDWIRLKKHQQAKDVDVLNILISQLKPCVEKRDVACIKKFFPDKTKHAHFAEWYHWDEFPTVTVNDELIAELKACLDYKNLLPHLYGSKGVNKVCIFRRRGDSKIDKDHHENAMLLNVTYPEAVRVNKKDSIFLPLK